MSMLMPAFETFLTAIIQGIGRIIFPRQIEGALGQLEAALKSAMGRQTLAYKRNYRPASQYVKLLASAS